MARTYHRDSSGRFASGGGGGGSTGGPAKVGRSGPRGGKTGTRTEQRRAAKQQAARTQQFSSKAPASAAKTAWKSAAGAARATRGGGALATRGPVRVNATPAPSKPPKIADALRGTLRTLAQSDARFYRELEQIVGPIKVQKPASRPAISGGTSSGGSQRGSVTRALRSTLRDLAQSDAARLREIQDITKPSTSGTIGGSKRKGVSGSGGSRALPGGKPKRKR